MRSVERHRRQLDENNGNPGAPAHQHRFHGRHHHPDGAVTVGSSDVNLAPTPRSMSFTFSEATSDRSALADTTAVGGTLEQSGDRSMAD